MSIDVCLLLEGTYPFVRGGVSTWVHQIIRGLPELRFGLVFLGGRRSDYGEPRYQLPDNAVHLESHYLEDGLRGVQPRPVRFEGGALAATRGLHECLRQLAAREPTNATEADLDHMLAMLEKPGGVRFAQFLAGSGAWDFMRERYQSGHADGPFLDYFWTLRLMHGPIFQLARIADKVPEARIYHTISTGFAGLLGTLLAQRRARPLLLSEHGIYTKERAIDLHRAEWIDALRPTRELGAPDQTATLRALWIRYFEGLGRLTYRASRTIISLYAGNRARQEQDGADPARTRVIVNGVQVKRFAGALAARGSQVPLRVGLVGRVVPIKDVKSFLRAMRVVATALPSVECWVVGGSDEEPGYAAECETLVRSLGLAGNVSFLGHRDVLEIFPQLGVLVLSSISEAQPLAVLEAFASGVPCVTTDVGACREQIEGLTPADRELGLAGRVVPFADSEALGRSVLELLRDEPTWLSCQRAGLARVHAYYTELGMLSAYRELYREAGQA